MFSYWEKDLFKAKYDNIIIGSGFSGLWLAFFLKKNNPDINIAIFERSVISKGASTKNAGFACFGSPSEIIQNTKDIGWDETLKWTKKRLDGINIIKENFGSAIDFDPCGASEVFDSKEEYQANIENIEILNKYLKETLGLSNHFYDDTEILSKCNFTGFCSAISNEAEASIHSAKLYYALYKSLVSQDVKFFFGTTILNFDANQGIVLTDNLGEFFAEHISVCTNAFSDNLLPEFKINPGRGQVLVTKPIENLGWNRTFHFDQGYYYFKSIGNRILLGGGRNLNFEGETTTEFAITETIQNKLEEILSTKLLPNIAFEIDQRWSGIMAFNDSKTPVSKIITEKLSASICMNGMGVALAPTLGQTLANQITNIKK